MNTAVIKYTVLFIFFGLVSFKSYSQEIKIELGSSEIAQNQTFTITLSVTNGKLKSYDNFPEIPGMVKRGTSSSSSTNIINGQITTVQSIIQSYMAPKEGVYELKPFRMNINGQDFNVSGKTIKVGPPAKQRSFFDPFEDDDDPFFSLFGRRQRQQPQEFIDIEEDAFLALTTNKDEVFTGEGFLTTFAFYVAEDNRAPLDFYDIGKQLVEILKSIKPGHCWEENFNIENITGIPVQINGKNYTQYKIYQAMYYPLNAEPVVFPSVCMKFIKYKVAKHSSFFGRQRQEDFKTFCTKAKTVKVKELPAHPLKDQVAVGNYRLEEKISDQKAQTGESLQYTWKITGEGNIASINEPKVLEDDVFSIYPPDVKQNIRRGNNKVAGHKNFDYYILPNEPGNYHLKDYINWIYFNPVKADYDTLRSKIDLEIIGESKKNDHITANDIGSFYDLINHENNVLTSRSGSAYFKIFVNILIVIMLAFTTVFIVKSRG